MSKDILYGLIGYPLTHSFSEQLFKDKFHSEGIDGVSYRAFPIGGIDELDILRANNPNLGGLNVTVPYKQQIMSYLDEISPVAAEIGAVNCVTVASDGKLTGYNTDAPAFRDELLTLIGRERPDALILGSGGASKAVEYVLRGLNINYKIVSRTEHADPKYITYEDLTPVATANHKLVINATPVGMYPNTEAYPDIDYPMLTSEHFLLDLIYNPLRSEFLKRGEAQGAKTLNGYGMLLRQAERSWDIWKHHR